MKHKQANVGAYQAGFVTSPAGAGVVALVALS